MAAKIIFVMTSSDADCLHMYSHLSIVLDRHIKDLIYHFGWHIQI